MLGEDWFVYMKSLLYKFLLKSMVSFGNIIPGKNVKHDNVEAISLMRILQSGATLRSKSMPSRFLKQYKIVSEGGKHKDVGCEEKP